MAESLLLGTFLFPDSLVRFSVADLFFPLSSWQRAFDFVLETYTLQVLPNDLRPTAIEKIAEFVAQDATLLLITRGRVDADDPGKMPWPLAQGELREFSNVGLIEVKFEDNVDDEDPLVKRFRIEYRKSS